MIALIDYGLGNICAFANIYRRLGIEVWAARTPDDLRRAKKIILPGVGAFDWAMSRLNESGLRSALDEEVINAKKPVLGVCVGMQMMANSSQEGKLHGLGWIDASVVKLDSRPIRSRIQLPHMGWNNVKPVRTDTLFRDIVDPRYYFLHSYCIKTLREDQVLATTEYGVSFTSAICLKNVYGTQFHPEKSHGWGVKLLKNFAELT